METRLFFNSEYYGSKFESRDQAAEAMISMVNGLKFAVESGAQKHLSSSGSALESVIAHDYTLRRWVNDDQPLRSQSDGNIDKDLRRYFIRLLDRAPFFEEQFEEAEEIKLCESSFIVEGKTQANKCATLCYIYSGIIISPPLSVFSNLYLKTTITYPDDECEEEIRCIYDQKSFKNHEALITSFRNANICSSADLWNQREVLFPSLVFCNRVGDQLNNLDQFSVVFTRLLELEQYSREWSKGPFKPSELPSKVTGESRTVKQDEKAMQSRSFTCPDGEARIFLWHMRATPGALRIHFYPCENKREIIVGHIGKKLYYRN